MLSFLKDCVSGVLCCCVATFCERLCVMLPRPLLQLHLVTDDKLERIALKRVIVSRFALVWDVYRYCSSMSLISEGDFTMLYSELRSVQWNCDSIGRLCIVCFWCCKCFVEFVLVALTRGGSPNIILVPNCAGREFNPLTLLLLAQACYVTCT